MRRFNFRKTTPRNNFTKIFGRVGARRTVIFTKRLKKKRRGFMQMYRRAKQGWRNQTFGRIQALKLRLQYGRLKPIRRFIK
jgi:hypothetical protein